MSVEPDHLVDSSVAVALVLADHADHTRVKSATGGEVLGLAGHAAFETYSVLTRVPTPLRLTAEAAHRAITTNFPEGRFLNPDEAAAVLDELPPAGVAGGAVYDALVGIAARRHGLELLSCDARAAQTYRALRVAFRLI